MLLLLASGLPLLSQPPVRAESTGNTTLYFTDAMSSLVMDENSTSFFSFASLSVTPPIKTKDSNYPPDILSHNTTKLRNTNLTTWLLSKVNPDFMTWLTVTYASNILFQNMSEIFSEFSDLFPGFNLSDIMLLFPSPLRIAETYQYQGDTPQTITGSATFTVYVNIPTPRHDKKLQDYLNVSLYIFDENSDFPILNKIGNTTIPITNIPGDHQLTATLTDIHATIHPGESLLASIEINPADRTSINWTKRINKLELRADHWVNRTHLPRLQQLGQAIQNISFILFQDLNLTPTIFSDLVQTLYRVPHFIYDSANHPTALLIPTSLAGPIEATQDYLHADHTMTPTPTANGTTKIPLTTTPTYWNATSFTRNKIIKNATANLYLTTPILLLRKPTIKATLYDNDVAIANTTVTPTLGLLNIKRATRGPIPIVFPTLTHELAYNHHLRLGLSLTKTPFLNSLRKITLATDATATPSTLTITYMETTNLHINATPLAQTILPGQGINYTITVTGTQADNITLNVTHTDIGNWTVTTPTTQATITAGGTATFHVIVNSTDDTKNAYNNTIKLTLHALGNTGIAKTTTTATISNEAVIYAVDIIGFPDFLNVQKGENRSFYIVIRNNNTGALDDTDSYTISATSENQWTVDNTDRYQNLLRSSTSTPDGIMIVEHIPPDTDITSDTITITVTSVRSPTTSATITILVKVQGSTDIQGVYDWFKSLSENLGLTDAFGDLAPIVLVAIIMVIIIFIIIIITLVLTRRVVRITAPELLKEIDTVADATYTIQLENTTRSPKTYTIETIQKHPATTWPVVITPQIITINGRQQATVTITVQPPPSTASQDWCELDVSVKADRAHAQHLSLLTLIKEGASILQVQNVTHTPPTFTAGERILTTFTIANEGKVSAPKATVLFYLNRKKIASIDCTIPAGGAADVQVPWIATKGKNTVKVQVKTE
jgi:hypothetical protein